ncbi:MAG TPA: adenylate/guanylate cyclase domain-containing protein [Gaiellaceae bacterium]
MQRERKVVTVLFADLVGFTSRAESLDPEDVHAILRPYHERLRSELERHGGTVEKFIGDAVMALFGAPTAHEDDPERALRAALGIRDWAREEGDLEVRIGITTGEALVSLEARPSEGEGMAAGDVVNTAARLQAAAPVNGIIVGERTYRATRRAIDYRELEPVHAKGKEEPLRVWEALQAHARFGVDVPQEARTALVGRERELEILRAALDRARGEASAQLVTLVGVPGIGKSRLLYELSGIVEADPDLITWRQGRSLPYAEGLSFWALAEIVKAQAGILETDDAEAAALKLAETVSGLIEEPSDQEWVRRHLAALAGLGGEDEPTGDDRRGEAFAAWRRLLEALAEQRPLVLVFEDLHWADDGLLDFVDHLVDWVSGVPLLVVGTARPELLERRSGWGGGKTNATTLSLAPLTAEDTARLLGSALGRPVIEAGEQAELLERVGGNPLYAEQYAQMLEERGVEGDLPLPESVQGIIGARLDALPQPEKQLLQDAAVIGKVFWPGAVAALGGEEDRFALEELLHALERKQFVRRDRRSSVADQTQYAFQHLLLRDVAYAQIPRTMRIEKHVLAAGWIEALGRPEDHAETLAHHYLSALEIARAAGQDVAELAPRARVALAEAGDRARRLSSYGASLTFYRGALELWPESAKEERADLLYRLAFASFEADAEGRDALLEEARAALLEVGERAKAAEADTLLGQFAWMRGDRDRAFEHLNRAQEQVQGAPPSPAKARVLSQVARFRVLAGDPDDRLVSEALELAEQFELDEIRAHALITRGTQHTPEGRTREDLEEGLRIALEGNMLPVAIRAYTALATEADERGEIREAQRMMSEAEPLAERLGDASIRWVRGNLLMGLFELGEWDRFSSEADEFLAKSETSPHYHDSYVLIGRAFVRFARGDVESALADQVEALEKARRIMDPQVLLPTLAASSYLLTEAGRMDEARPPFDEALSADPELYNFWIEALPWAADSLDRRDEVLQALQEAVDNARVETARLLLAQEFSEAAEIFRRREAVHWEAQARLCAAERLVAEGRRAEADEQLQRALAFYRSVGATLYIRKGEALLPASA